jgi:hypothetical protein
MLLLLSGEVHEVHQSERLHHDGRLRKELLLVGQGSVQSFASKHRKVTNNDILLFLLETLLCFKNTKSDLFTNNCNLILWFGFYKCFPFNCPRHYISSLTSKEDVSLLFKHFEKLRLLKKKLLVNVFKLILSPVRHENRFLCYCTYSGPFLYALFRFFHHDYFLTVFKNIFFH